MAVSFQKGEYVKYASNGVCLIEDVSSLDFNPKAKDATYYILRPLSTSSTTIFVPTDNELLLSRMRKLLTKEEIDAVIARIDTKNPDWPEDRKERANLFGEIVKRDDPVELLSLARAIYLRRAELNAKGKKLMATDGNVLEQIERLVENEFTFVLDITPAEVNEYIKKKMN